MQESEYYEHQPRAFGLVSRISYAARRSMFDSLMSLSNLDENSLVLDVGVTSNKEAESNFFEKWYPHPHNITAVGIEDASFLEEEYEGLSFFRYDGGKRTDHRGVCRKRRDAYNPERNGYRSRPRQPYRPAQRNTITVCPEGATCRSPGATRLNR